VAAESDNAMISRPATLNAAEAEAQLDYVKKALEAASGEVRQTALTEALLRFGQRFGIALNMLPELAAQSKVATEPYDALVEDFTALFERWLAGERLTSRADEAERRVAAAVGMATENPALGRLAAQAILALPDDHPQRDVTQARRLLVGYLGAEGTEREPGMELLAELVDLEEPADEELAEQIASGLALAPGVHDETVRRFRFLVASRYSLLASKARDDGDPRRQHRLAERGIRMLEDIEPDTETLLLLAALFSAAEDDARAAETLKAIDDATR
jgi:hypothetical protein